MPDQWINKAEAVARYAISERQIQRYMSDGRIRRAELPREPHQKTARVVCNVEDLERFKRGEFQPQPAALPAVRLLAAPSPVAEPAPEVNRVSVLEKLWLTLDEAQALSGLARADLLGLCREGKLVARKSGGWRIRRASLEQFEG